MTHYLQYMKLSTDIEKPLRKGEVIHKWAATYFSTSMR